MCWSYFIWCSIRHITAEVGAAVLRAAVAEELAEGHGDIGPRELMHMSKVWMTLALSLVVKSELHRDALLSNWSHHLEGWMLFQSCAFFLLDVALKNSYALHLLMGSDFLVTRSNHSLWFNISLHMVTSDMQRLLMVHYCECRRKQCNLSEEACGTLSTAPLFTKNRASACESIHRGLIKFWAR